MIARLGETRGRWSHKEEMDAFQKKFNITDAGLLHSGVIGVDSLRERTEVLLKEIVMLNVPKMLKEVRASRTLKEAELKKIGKDTVPNADILRSCVKAIEVAISEIGRLTNSSTEQFEAHAKQVSERHAKDKSAVEDEVGRRMSPHEIPWYLGKFAFEK